MWQNQPVIDADGHVMEPLWLWQEYVDPAFKDSCLRVARDSADGDKLIIDGRPSQLIRRLGGIAPAQGQEIPDWNSLPVGRLFASYRDSCTLASWNTSARLAWLDGNGIDATFLFPSLGLIWPREVDSCGPYAVAHYQAYNRWILDMTSATRGRLIPVAQMAFTADAAETVAGLAAWGFRDVMLPLGTVRSLQPADPFFAAAQDLGMTVHLHKVAIPHFLLTPETTTTRSPEMGAFFNHVNEILPGQLCLTALLGAKVLDRCPRVRFVFHECNVTWLPAWLDRAQESYETLSANGVAGLPDLPPRAYLSERDTMFFSVGLGEELARLPAELIRSVLLATDYPHPGTPPSPRDAWIPALATMPIRARHALMGGNALRLTRESKVTASARPK
jgi:uncharacterized protein